MAYAHLAAGAARVKMHLGRETKTARPPPLVPAPIFLVAMLTVPGEATNSHFLAEARFCAIEEMIQFEDTMGHFCEAGRSPPNLAPPPNATCRTRNSDDAEEMMPANLRFPPVALFCDYGMMETATGYFCEVGRQPSSLAHPPCAACPARRSDHGWNVTELIRERAPASLLLGSESQLCLLYKDDCPGLPATIEEETLETSWKDLRIGHVKYHIEDNRRMYKWYRIRDRGFIESGRLPCRDTRSNAQL
jgi:hypothetical protein